MQDSAYTNLTPTLISLWIRLHT